MTTTVSRIFSDYLPIENVANYTQLKVGDAVAITTESWKNHCAHHKMRNLAMWSVPMAFTGGFGLALAIPGEMGGAFVLTELMQFTLGAAAGAGLGATTHSIVYQGKPIVPFKNILDMQELVGVVTRVDDRFIAEGKEIRVKWLKKDGSKSYESHLPHALVKIALKTAIQADTIKQAQVERAELEYKEQQTATRISVAVEAERLKAQRDLRIELARRKAIDEKRINDSVRAIIAETKDINPNAVPTHEVVVAQRKAIAELNDQKSGKNKVIAGLLSCNALWLLLILL